MGNTAFDCLQTAKLMKCDEMRSELCSTESSYIISFDTSLLLNNVYSHVKLEIGTNLQYVRKICYTVITLHLIVCLYNLITSKEHSKSLHQSVMTQVVVLEFKYQITPLPVIYPLLLRTIWISSSHCANCNYRLHSIYSNCKGGLLALGLYSA